MKLIEFKNVSKRYDKRTISGVSDLNFTLNRGEVVSLIGPSGAGKTTTLKLLMQEIAPDSGSVFRSDQVKVAYIAQSTKLYEDKTVFENLELVLDFIEDVEKRTNQIRTVLQSLELTNEIHHKVSEISGGQKQRVIVAQALVLNPTLLLMDEPFEHLDQSLRLSLMEELFEIFRDKNISVLWVTHEISEALSYSDRILVLNYGVLEQSGTPEDIYLKPKNLFVANFFADTTTLIGELIRESESELLIKAMGRELIFPKSKDFKSHDHKNVLLVFRPECFEISESGQGDFSGKIVSKKFLGSHYLLKVRGNHFHELSLLAPNDRSFKHNEKIEFVLNASKVYALGEV